MKGVEKCVGVWRSEKNVGKCGGRHRKPQHTSHSFFPQFPNLPQHFSTSPAPPLTLTHISPHIFSYLPHTPTHFSTSVRTLLYTPHTSPNTFPHLPSPFPTPKRTYPHLSPHLLLPSPNPNTLFHICPNTSFSYVIFHMFFFFLFCYYYLC